MNVIKQTNRTIVFEEFNQEIENILTIIGDVENVESLDDEKIKEINEKLVVESFDDFLKKFKPCIYSYLDIASKKIVYTINKNPQIPDSMYNEIPINMSNSFIKMLSTLLENRKNIDLKNMDFKFEDILELISPKKIINDIKQIRKEINYLYNKYEKLSDNNPKKLILGDKLNEKFYDASLNYNNVLSMLPLAIEDIKTRLAIGENKSNLNIELIKLGYMEFSEKGEIEFKESIFEKNKEIMLPDNSKKLQLIFKNDYNQSSNNPQEYISNLIVRTFVPITSSNLDIDYEKEVYNYNQYLKIYQESQEDFIKIAKSLIEKVMGIKIFFEQYNTKIKIMKPKLLITNVKNEILLSPKQKIKIDKYLNSVNNKNDYENTIWFGIFPNLSLTKNDETSKKNIFNSNFNKIYKEESNSIEELSSLLEITSRYKIQVFFSFVRSNETTFNDLSINGINKYLEKTKILENNKFSEYAISTIPNFTLIPYDKSGIKLDKKAEYENGLITYSKEEIEFFIEGIYVDAAYVGAGLVASYQCPGYLKERFKNTLNNNPGVRFNIEQDDNSLLVKTTLAREITGYTNNLKDEINRDNYGMIFSSENGYFKNEKNINSIVYKARSLYKGLNYHYEPIYKTTTTTYIERILRYVTQDFKQDKLNEFFSNNPNSQKTLWLKEINNVNSILKMGDDITHNIDLENNTCQLNLKFAGEIKNLRIEINKNE